VCLLDLNLLRVNQNKFFKKRLPFWLKPGVGVVSRSKLKSSILQSANQDKPILFLSPTNASK
jgi:hypothetical protein